VDTIPDLWQAIADAISHFMPRECGNYFEAAGYEHVRIRRLPGAGH
jgi:hypothetical protein